MSIIAKTSAQAQQDDSFSSSETSRPSGQRLGLPGNTGGAVHGEPVQHRERPTVDGKFLRVDGVRFTVKGVTYGTFAPDENGYRYPELDTVSRDFAQMRATGINTVRIYIDAPPHVFDLAVSHGLKVIAGIYWEGRECIYDDADALAAAVRAVRQTARRLRDHPTLLMYCIGNEIPPSVVRWHGQQQVERFLRSLYDAVKAEDPQGLVTYANYPSTEYLDLSFLDVLCFNVYLLERESYQRYLRRLQTLSHGKPLLLGEVGHDTRHDGEERQAELLRWMLADALTLGLCGAVVFAWTDEWVVGDNPVEDWDFGLVDRARRPKPGLGAVRAIFQVGLHDLLPARPKVSVVVCTYNSASTLPECVESLLALRYPCCEIIVVNDGSRDETREILERYPVRAIHVANGGLSRARNLGAEAATGEIVAYTDADVRVDPDWLTYLVAKLQEPHFMVAGGPNLVPPEDGPIAQEVGAAVGGPNEVLLDDGEAEHVPGCNMAFWRCALDEIGGFDAEYTAAGDDVDVCWRLMELGYKIGFHPSAIVWHHRRPSVRAYLKQQHGYGIAEAALERKYPEKFNLFGYIYWRGAIYASAARLPFLRPRVYGGEFGSALFQSVYNSSPAPWLFAPVMFEWYALGLGAMVGGSIAGIVAWGPAPFVTTSGGLALLTTVGLCGFTAWQGVRSHSPQAQHRPRLGGVALLNLLQPVVRGWGRLRRLRTLAEVLPEREAHFWSGPSNREQALQKTTDLLRRSGCRIDPGNGWRHWDFRCQLGGWAEARVTTAEQYDGVLRWRWELRPTPRAWASLAGILICAAWGMADPRAFLLLVPLLASLLHAVREQSALSKVLPRCVSQASRSSGMVPMEQHGRPPSHRRVKEQRAGAH
jgi:O-antigen biosynthesis protein